MAAPRDIKREPSERTWTPANFVLTVVGATIVGALFADWLLSTATAGEPIRMGVNAFEDWLAELDIILVGLGSLFLVLIWIVFAESDK